MVTLSLELGQSLQNGEVPPLNQEHVVHGTARPGLALTQVLDARADDASCPKAQLL